LLQAALVLVWGALLLIAFTPFQGLGFAGIAEVAAAGWNSSPFHRAFLAETAGRLVFGHAGVFLWAGALAGFGLVLLGLFRAGTAGPRSERIALAAGIGFGAGSLGWLGAGLVGLWEKGLAWAAVAAGLWLLGRNRGTGRRARGGNPARAGGIPGWIVVGFQAMAAIMLAGFLGTSLIPETAADPLLYHLALPGVFAMEHRVVAVTQMFHGSLPMGAPMHYGWMLLTAGEPAVRAWRWWVIVATVWIIVRLCAREGRPGAGWVAAGVFLALPQTVWVGTAAFVDGEVCLLGLLACLAVRRMTERPRGPRWLTLAAVLGAAACGVKYQAVFLLPGLAVAGSWRAIPRRAAVAACVVAVLLAPWWARNELVMGNPVYPFADRTFHAFRPMPPGNRALLARHTESRVLWGPREALLFPWKSAKGMNEETRLGPVFLVAVPWLVLAPPAGAFATYAWIAGTAGVTWSLVTHVSRYLTAGWVLACVVIAAGLGVRGPLRAVRAVLLAVFGLDVLVRALPGFASAGLPVLAGRASPREVWARSLPNSYAGIARKAEALPPGARILLVGDIRAAYWPRPALNHSPYDVQLAHEILAGSRTPAEAAKRFRQAAGWVYVNDRESGRLKYTRDFPMLEFDHRTERIAAGVWRGWMDEAARDGEGVIWRVRLRPRRTGPWPEVPLTFDDAALRRAYAGSTSLTYEAPGGTKTTIRLER